LLRSFTLHRPETAEEACGLLARLGEEAAPYAGGTELLLMMKLGLLGPRHLIDIKRLAGFDTIRAEGPGLVIGATVTHRMLERSGLVQSRWPLVARVARQIANVRVRNVGTVGGNLAFADPHSDLATLLLALEARVELVSPRGRRELAMAEFIRGPWETARQPDELLSAVRLPAWRPGTTAAYIKFGVHERPTLGIALALVPEHAGDPRARVADARLAIGCVNPRPARVAAAEARLRGGPVADLVGAGAEVAALAAASVDAADDLHGSADYKRAMVEVFVRRALQAALARARGEAPVERYPYAVVA
jgi:carbon-monoxide dehydrogenase medium subunit